MTFRLFFLLTVATLLTATPAFAQELTLDETLLDGFEWRSIGPANMSGRITDIEGLPGPSKTFYVAQAAGGIWKTTNNGITFRPLFQDERITAMGDLAIAPSDVNQIWAGTGEEDSRNSISPGGGIYKSMDAGLTWELKGLEDTEHIGKILVHPTNPDVVWVAGLGPLWREGGGRGLYKTSDGGDTWEQVAVSSERAGFVDIAIHPRNPDVLFATSWERVRGPYYLQSGGPGSALWKSTDGGDTWERHEAEGIPTTDKGRLMVAFAPSYPRVMYMMVEAAPEEGSEDANQNGLYRSDDEGDTWEKVNSYNSRPFYYSGVWVDPMNPDRVYFSSFRYSDDGGRTAGAAAQQVHVDFHAMWIDPNDPERFVVGNDGGIGVSFDKGGNYWFPNNIAQGQFYNISYGMETPYTVCGGLQDNYSWCGPSRKAQGGITNHDWFQVSGGDGFVTQQDPRNPDIVYSESQGGNMGRSNLATGERVSFGRPNWRDSYREIQDQVAELWPDSTQPMPSQHSARIAELTEMATADSTNMQFRYNWNTPFFLSPHNPDVVYAAGNRVMKSMNQGDDFEVISPDMSRADAEKIRISTTTTGGITPDATGAETFATVTSLNESPVRAGQLYAGTDDGNLWVSPDDGESWMDVTEATSDLVPDGSYVSRIEPSKHVADRFYVTFDNHRRGDFTPYVLVSENNGASFSSISSDLPTGKPDFAHVVREDHVNPNLLFVGTDVGAYVSLDRGDSWQSFSNGLPTVPVHDLQIHPRDSELIAGTHGRSIWIVDIEPLQQLSSGVVASAAHLFEPSPAYQFGGRRTGGEFTAQAYFSMSNPGGGAEFRYWLGEDSNENAELVITDSSGEELTTINGQSSKGLHRGVWNMNAAATRLPLSPSEMRDSIAVEARLAVVIDSLVEEGEEEEDVAEAVENLRNAGGGGFNFGGRGGGAGGGVWQDRPAEGRAQAGGGGRGFGGTPEGGGTLQQRIQNAVRPQPAGRGRRGRGGGGLFPGRSEQNGLVEPGTYTVTLKVDGEEFSHTFTVGRADTAPIWQ
jgi:hypothetical protein